MRLPFLRARRATAEPAVGTPPRHDAAVREERRSRRVSRALGGLLLAVALAACLTGLRTDRALRETREAEEVRRVLAEAHERLVDAQIGWARIESGEIPRLRVPPLVDDPAVRSRAKLQPLAQLVDSSLASAWRRVILEVDAAALASISDTSGVARLRDRVEAETEVTTGFLSQANQIIEAQRLRAVAPVAELGEMSAVFLGLVLCSVALSLVILRRSGANRREFDHHLRGALLTEEMLESYSRRLEQANERLQQTSLLELQSLSRAAEELRSPLHGILGFLDLVREGNCESREEELQFVDQAAGQARALLAQVNALDDLCRLQEGRLLVDMRPCDAGAIVQSAVQRHAADIEARGVGLLLLPPAEGWPRLTTDPDRLGQMLDTLLGNAARATREGSIRVTGRIAVEGEPTLRIEVADTGMQTERSETPRFADGNGRPSVGEENGAGLRLALAEQLARRMGGTMGIERDANRRGTRAWILLPIATESAGAGENAAAA